MNEPADVMLGSGVGQALIGFFATRARLYTLEMVKAPAHDQCCQNVSSLAPCIMRPQSGSFFLVRIRSAPLLRSPNSRKVWCTHNAIQPFGPVCFALLLALLSMCPPKPPPMGSLRLSRNTATESPC